MRNKLDEGWEEGEGEGEADDDDDGVVRLDAADGRAFTDDGGFSSVFLAYLERLLAMARLFPGPLALAVLRVCADDNDGGGTTTAALFADVGGRVFPMT